MKILIITNYYYPKNVIAAYRMNAFAEYLTKAGHSVTVLTGENETRNDTYMGIPVHYLAEKNRFCFREDENKLIRYFKIGLRKLCTLVSVDLLEDWTKAAIEEGFHIINRQNIDIILSSYGEVSPHKVALALKAKYPDIKWIADMRDEMSLRPNINFFLKKKLEKLEYATLSKANIVTSVSEPLLAEFKNICPSQKTFLEVRNGYDYNEVRDSNFCEQFTLLYTGNFYGRIKPYQLFKAIEELVNEGKLPWSMKFDILGNLGNISIPQSLKKIVRQLPKTTHDEAIRQLQKADVLVVIHPSERPGVFTGKIFDYLPSNKIILSLTDPEDVIGKLLDETNAGFAVANENLNGIKERLIKCYTMWKNKQVLNRNWDKIRQQRREAQVEKLVDYIQKEW